jgi:hypothetical protein
VFQVVSWCLLVGRASTASGLADPVGLNATVPYGVLVGVLLYLDLRARKERLTLEALRADLQASAA